MEKRWRALLGALVALSALGALGTARAQHMPLPPEELYERLAPSVWLVEVRRADGEGGLGSAVVIAPETLVTNCHVVEKASTIAVAHEGRRLPARVQYSDTARDLCQLQAPGLAAPAVRIASASSLRVGATVYALGNPRGLELTLSHGLLSALRRNPSGAVQYLQVSVPISPGSSGGGLFDVYGRLVGITTFLIKESQNLNFAMPADFVVELPQRSGGTAVARLDPPILPLPRPQPPVASAPA
ncbi:MAG: serine protease, partial [Comamonadaceae bacterium]